MGDLTVKQAADRLGYSERWVTERLRTGKLQGRHRGRMWLIPEAEIERYYSLQTGEAVPGAKLEGSQPESSFLKDQGEGEKLLLFAHNDEGISRWSRLREMIIRVATTPPNPRSYVAWAIVLWAISMMVFLNAAMAHASRLVP